MLRQLGEPDYRAIGDKGFLYQWSDQQTGVVVGFPLPILLTVSPVQTKVILIRFGAGEVVSSAAGSTYDQHCFGVPGSEMMYCSSGSYVPVGWQALVDNDYLDTTAGILSAPDERVREVFFIAAYREDAEWVDGAVVVSNHAVIFVGRASPDSPFNRVLMTLPRQAIADVRLSGGEDVPSSAVAAIGLADGGRVILAFGDLTNTIARPPFDVQRSKRFVDSVSYLISDSR